MSAPVDSAPVAPVVPAGLAPDGGARTQRAAQDFVAVALGELLAPMFAGLDATGGVFGGGVGEATFRPMLINEMAKSLAQSGGLGLTVKVEQAMRALEQTARNAPNPKGGRVA